ncbi:YdcF family protein [Prochlorococcus sp. MIT 1341]|uniref:YdcF family protein n=1 Tax=Prochlorococcus sp. MIT 1341 TaxID=3096221 RepID=UPI002A7627C6|nr:YdcF family protein [Prochlorococcus sp. MIT 1341]
MAYILSKILPLLIMPLGLSLTLLFVAVFSRKRKVIISSLLILWSFSTGIISSTIFQFVESPWKRRSINNAPLADAIVVLSGSLHPAPGADQIVEWSDPDRFTAGVQLYKATKAPRILFTGGVNPFYPALSPEGQIYIQEARLIGIPARALQTTPPVRNTAEEASAIKELIKNSDYPLSTRVLLVTSAFHMQRAKRLFEQQGLVVLPFPVDFKTKGKWAGSRWEDPLQWIPNASSLNLSTIALREMIGRIVYRAW